MSPTRSRALLLPLVLVALTLSGAAGLIAEVVWSRAVATLFGSVVTATGLVLGLFMAGLGVGSALGGRLARRLRRPLIAFGLVEISIGILVFLSPALLRAVAPLVVSIDRNLSPALAPLVPAAFVLLILGPIVVLMGMTFPLFLAHVAREHESFSSDSGLVYGVNTLGAVAGTTIAGFWLLPSSGITYSLQIAAATDLFVGACAIGIGIIAAPIAEALPAEKRSVSGISTPLVRLALLTAFLGGAAALILEVAWFRALMLIFGSSVYAISMMLSAFLLGLAAGAIFVAPRADRVADPVALLANWHVLIGFTATAVTFLVQLIPILYILVLERIGAGFGTMTTATFVLVFAALIIPTALMGAALPTALRMASTGLTREESVSAAGRVYAASSLGSALGAVTAGFVLIPLLGVRGAVATAVGLSLAAALLLMRRSEASLMRRSTWQVAAVTTVLWAAWFTNLIPWDWRVLTGGYYAYAHLYSGDRLAATGPTSRPLVFDQSLTEPFSDAAPRFRFQASGGVTESELLSWEDGQFAQVAVIEEGGLRTLLLNGKADASNAQDDMRTQLLLGHLPALLSPSEPRGAAAVIGLGSAVTTAAVAAWPFDRIIAAEIEPAVVRATRWFVNENRRVLDDPRVELRIDDGRRVLARHQQPLALLTSEPTNLWMSGVSLLFTREFFELAASRLGERGVFCQWIHLYQVGQDDVRTLLATMSGVFPHMIAFADGADLLLVGSRAPLQLDPAVWRQRLIANPTAATMLAEAGVYEVSQIARGIVADERGIRAWSAGAPLHTDDRPILEFSAARRMGLDRSGPILASLVAAAAQEGPIALGASGSLGAAARP
jgi:spermidine synthase